MTHLAFFPLWFCLMLFLVCLVNTTALVLFCLKAGAVVLKIEHGLIHAKQVLDHEDISAANMTAFNGYLAATNLAIGWISCSQIFQGNRRTFYHPQTSI